MVNTYDSKNRITSTGYGSAQQSYTYDQYGQLTQTVDTANGFTENYSYDQRGNILTKTKVYDDTSFPAETTTFSYGNSAWQDELTSVNGTSLTYDANGNVLTYGNMEFEWTNGRVLSEITVTPDDPSGTEDVYSYTYDESGIRSSKIVNGVTTYFTTKDGVILSQTDGTNTMYFQYDNSGNPTGFLYNGTQYLYLTNQMGDVIGITDNTGALIATYTYGAWGEVLATTPATTGNSAQLAIANANPLRYRGYYLDAETGYYYLQSRYYSPSLLRFLSADDYSRPCYVKDIVSGNNLFSYCYGDPVNNTDRSGTIISAKVKLALFGGIMGFVVQFLSDLIRVYCMDKNWSKVPTYVLSVGEGAWDAVYNRGYFVELAVAVGRNVVNQLMNYISKKKDFSGKEVFMTAVDFTLTYVIKKKLKIKEPKYIRDIKKEARAQGIKGTKRLTAYLNNKIYKCKIDNIKVSAAVDIAKQAGKATATTFRNNKTKYVGGGGR